MAAVTEQLAQDAEKIKIDYEPLDPVYDPIEAMKESAPQVMKVLPIFTQLRLSRRVMWSRGFKDAYRIYENAFSTQMVEHVPMEPRASIADWDGNGRVTHFTQALAALHLAGLIFLAPWIFRLSFTSGL